MSPASGTYLTDQSVTITSATEGATIHYTVNGYRPTSESPVYTGPIPVAGGGTTANIKAIAVKNDMLNSEVVRQQYIIQELVAQNAVAFNRLTTEFVDPITVTVTADTTDATIEYTVDGSDPTCEDGNQYDSPANVAITTTTTLKVISCKTGYTDSSIGSETYTLINPDATISAGVGTPLQDAIDAASDGDVLFVEAGTYDEGEISITKPLTLIGHGSGSDDSDNTVITHAVINENVIQISTPAILASETVALKNLHVTGALGSGNDGSGIHITTTPGIVELDNVVATGNAGSGLAFNITSDPASILIQHSTFSNNTEHGVRFPSSAGSIDDLMIDECVFDSNTLAGIMMYTPTTTNFTIQNSSFIENANAAYQFADLILTGFSGDIDLTNVTIESSAADSAIRMSGSGTGVSPNKKGTAAIGTVNFTNLTISGTQQANGAYPAGAIVITRYLDLDGLTFDDVVISSTAPHGIFFGTTTDGTTPDLGNLSLEGTFSLFDIGLGKHGNSGSYAAADIDINATGVNFAGATSDADIETRVNHSIDDGALGTVSWTTPL